MGLLRKESSKTLSKGLIALVVITLLIGLSLGIEKVEAAENIYFMTNGPSTYAVKMANLGDLSGQTTVYNSTDIAEGNATAVAVDPAGGKVYFSYSGYTGIYITNLDGTAGVTKIDVGDKVTDIAVDSQQGKLYFMTNGPSTYAVKMANLGDLSGQTTVYNSTDIAEGDATAVAVDPAGGKVYFSYSGYTGIYMTNLDGTAGVTKIDVGDKVTDVAVDSQHGKLYFMTNGPTSYDVKMANLGDLSGQTTVYNSTDIAEGNATAVAVDPAGGKVYFSYSGYTGIYLTNLDGTAGVAKTDVGDKINALAVPLNTQVAPVASAVSITGTELVGHALTGHYTYTDSNGDLEGVSTFKWYRSDDASGTNKVEISEATSDTYVLQAADEGKYISFEVTPVAQTGTSPGAAVESGYTGAIATETTVLSVTTPSIGTYRAGRVLDFKVNFSKPVIADTAGGTPYILISLDTGGTVNADFFGPLDEDTLIFRYAVQAGDEDTNGITVESSAITANGGTIKDGAGNDADLTINISGTIATVLVDGIAPGVTSINRVGSATTNAAAVDYTVAFSENVTGIDVSDFTLTTTGTAAGVISSLSGSGSTYTVTVSSLTGNGTIRLDLNNTGTSITDVPGNAISGGYISGQTYTLDRTPPTVSSVTVPSNATYVAGQNLDFTLNFSENVTVNTTGGTPYIPITLNTGGVVNAGYLSGSGTSALVFRYTVQTGNADPDGITVGNLTDNGGTLRDSAGNDAVQNLNSVGSTTAVLVDAVVPTILSAAVPTDDTYITGDNLDFTVNFSENIAVDTGGGTPYIAITLESGGTVNAGYISGSGTNTLIFRYTVQAGNADSDGLAVGTAISANGAILRDSAGNDAERTLNGIGVTTGVLVDGIAPGVTSINRVGSAITNASSVDYTVAFTENVTGIDVSDFTLTTTGTAAGVISSVTGSGSTYTVAVSSLTGNGIIRLDLNNAGTGITDVPGNVISGGYTSGQAYTIDRTNPTVSSVTVPSNATYTSGQNLDFTVNFSENVTVDTTGGTPYIPITLETGGTVNAGYASGSGTSTLVFRYTVQSGNADPDGVTVGALTANGGTLRDSAGNDAVLTLNSVGSTSAVLVDAIVPTVSSVSVPNDDTYITGDNLDFTVNFNENIAVDTGGGTPYIAITLETGGTVNAGYISGSGTNTLVFRYTVQAGNADTDGITVGSAIIANGGTIKDGTGNDADLTLNNVGVTDAVLVDTEKPVINGIALAPGNAFIDVTFSEGIYGAADGSAALTPEKLRVTFLRNGGTATDVAISTVKNYDNINEAEAGTLVGGEGTVRVFLDVTGVPAGVEVIQIKPTDGSSIYDAAGNAMLATESSGAITLKDETAPIPGGSGAITTGTGTTSTIELTWTTGTDTVTALENLQYKLVSSTSNNIDTLANAIANGTTATDWTANLTSQTVTGLTAGTTYYFNVIIRDEAGNMEVYTAVSKATTTQSSSSHSRDTTSGYIEVIVNGKAEAAATAETKIVEDKTVTTVTVNAKKIEEKLNAEVNNSTIVIPFDNKASDVIVGVLNGHTVKYMETKEATLEIKTENVTYKLPAAQINIDNVSTQIGQQVELKDIKVNVTIAEPSADTVRVVESTANKNKCQIVVKPIEFNITCTSGSKTVKVSKFNGYVERTVAIPEGIDPSKITTGVVLNPDGTFSHVPTTIVIIDGKYYAKINSLTNSTYSVIWNQKEFADVANHWSKAAVNDMYSRMIVTGTAEGLYLPDRAITRAEFATIMVKSLGLSHLVADNTSFSDIKAGTWYANPVEIAGQYGIIKGYADGSFRPTATITREEAMTMLANAMKITKLQADLKDIKLNKFTDADKASAWAKEGIVACVDTEVVTGRSGQTIAPKANITRAEVAQIMENFLLKSGLIN